MTKCFFGNKEKRAVVACFRVRIDVLHVEAVENYGEAKGKTINYCQKNCDVVFASR